MLVAAAAAAAAEEEEVSVVEIPESCWVSPSTPPSSTLTTTQMESAENKIRRHGHVYTRMHAIIHMDTL